MLTDYDYMAKAIELAWRSLNITMPNPRVGCVLVKDDQIVGRGYTQPAGSDHAEVQAMKDAGDQTKGATAYVTLEPCSHYGRTPPCAKGLIEAGVRRVVIAMMDPNPVVSGNGIRMLQDAGVEVEIGVLESDARELNPGFIRRMSEQRPWVRVKVAQSLDGRTAMASGESKWITGPEARADVQRWRARSCVMVTGIETVLADNPSLNVRADELDVEVGPQPLRVILDSQGRIPLDSKILQPPEQSCVVLAKAGLPAEQTLNKQGVQTLVIPGEQGIDLKAFIQNLGKEHNEIMVEAGATLSGAFLMQGLVDELIVYTAPKLLGHLGRPMLKLPIHEMADSLQLDVLDQRMLGQDQRTIYKVRKS